MKKNKEKKADDGGKEKMSFPFLLLFRRLCAINSVVDDGRIGSLA
jgi:hypothetical protein